MCRRERELLRGYATATFPFIISFHRFSVATTALPLLKLREQT